jgi:hypothetical protein
MENDSTQQSNTKKSQNPSKESLTFDPNGWKANWLKFLVIYFTYSFEKRNECEIVGDRLSINGYIFKVDINDYTGSEEKYIFFNLHNGRIIVCNGDKKSVHRVEFDNAEE